jgi:hypothetical protein
MLWLYHHDSVIAQSDTAISCTTYIYMGDPPWKASVRFEDDLDIVRRGLSPVSL